MRFDITTQNNWIRGRAIAGVRFSVCQAVRVIAGPHEGRVGKLVSLFDLEPEPVFHLEASDGEDVLVGQSEIAALDSTRSC